MPFLPSISLHPISLETTVESSILQILILQLLFIAQILPARPIIKTQDRQTEINSDDRMPVWTAFITHQIHSRKWIRLARPGSCTVLLADLYRYLFDNEYSPPISPGGEHDLTFVEPDGAFVSLFFFLCACALAFVGQSPVRLGGDALCGGAMFV